MRIRLIRGVVSLLDMLEFCACLYVEMATKLAAWEKTAGESNADVEVKPNFLAQILTDISTFGTLCSEQGFNSPAQQCYRIVEMAKKREMRMTCGCLRENLTALRTRVDDDLKSEKFLHLSLRESELYKSPLKQWGAIINRFGEVSKDAEEMNKCLALCRYSAAMFHALHVAELGAVILGDFIGVTDPKKGWGPTERKLRELIKDGRPGLPPKLRKKYEFLEQMHREIDSMVLAWRHKVDHAANHLAIVPNTDFAPDIAEHIISSVRMFMLRLTEDMPNV